MDSKLDESQESHDRMEQHKIQELSLREREVAARELEVSLKQRELKRSWLNPIVLGLFATSLGLVGNFVVARINNNNSIDVEHMRLQSNLILESIKTDPNSACTNLLFLVRLQLLHDEKNTIHDTCPVSSPVQKPSLVPGKPSASTLEMPALTKDQLNLVALSARDLAKTIQDEFTSRSKSERDLIDKREKEREDEYVKEGKTRPEAQQLINSMHTGGTASSWTVDYRAIAREVAAEHAGQIHAIVNVFKSDPSRFQGELTMRVSALPNKCDIPGNDVKDCADALNALASAVE